MSQNSMKGLNFNEMLFKALIGIVRMKTTDSCLSRSFFMSTMIVCKFKALGYTTTNAMFVGFVRMPLVSSLRFIMELTYNSYC